MVLGISDGPYALNFHALADFQRRWHSNTTEGYTDFMAEMGDFFLEPMLSVRYLQFSADKGNPVGCIGSFHSMFAVHLSTLL